MHLDCKRCFFLWRFPVFPCGWLLRVQGIGETPMSVRSRIFKQFAKPAGALGYLAGIVMANRPSNLSRIRWTVGLLRIDGCKRILEIGCGPGNALMACAEKSPGCLITGIDHSDVMIRQAGKRLKSKTDSGKTQLIKGELSDLNPDKCSFDRIFSINVVQFLPDMERFFREQRERLADGGLVLTTYQPRHKNPTSADARQMGRKIEQAMTNAGLSVLSSNELDLKPAISICITGKKVLT